MDWTEFARSSPFALCLMVSLALLPIRNASAQSSNDASNPASLKQLSLEALSQLEVTTPSKQPESVLRTPAAIYVITGEDIRRSGVTTIPEALRLAPGVEVARIDGSKWSIGIRGFGTRLARSVLVLIDGRTVYTPLFAGTYWEVQDTLLEDVDRIEVIRGPGGTIWGPNAVDGVINIITKSAKDTKGLYSSLISGSLDHGTANVRYGGEHGGLDYRVYAKAYDRGAEYHTDHDNFDRWFGGQAGFRMDWSSIDLSGGLRDAFTLQGDGYAQHDGERVAVSTYVPAQNSIVDGEAVLSGANLLFRWTRNLTDTNNFQLQAYYDRTDRREPNFGEDRDTFDIDFLERTRISARQELLYGAGVRGSEGRFDEVTTGLVFLPLHRLDYLLSGFFEDDITLVPNQLMLTAGIKVLRTNYVGFKFEPSIRLMWTPTNKDSLWISYTHAIRTPSDAEEDFYLSSFESNVAPNLNLFARFNANQHFSPEQMNGYELGYRRLFSPKFYVDIATFLNHYHDLFSEDITGPISVETSLPFPGASPPEYLLIPAQFENDLRGQTKGIEVAPEWRPTSFWRLRGSYSYLQMNLTKEPGTPELGTAPLIDGTSPQHQADIDSSFDVGKKLQVDLVYRYVGSLPASNQLIPAYSTGDVRVAWRFNRHVELSLNGRNLFQHDHFEYNADPGGPVGILRSVYASVSFASR